RAAELSPQRWPGAPRALAGRFPPQRRGIGAGRADGGGLRHPLASIADPQPSRGRAAGLGTDQYTDRALYLPGVRAGRPVRAAPDPGTGYWGPGDRRHSRVLAAGLILVSRRSRSLCRQITITHSPQRSARACRYVARLRRTEYGL